MTGDSRADAVVVTYTPTGDRATRRLIFEPWSGPEADWERIERVRQPDGTFRTVGSELVAWLDVDTPD